MNFDYKGMSIEIKTWEEDWEEVKKAALTTIHKKSTRKDISKDWKEAMIIGRHSPIREFRVKLKITNIPRWIADQLVRHNVGVNNYMGTMRPDRGNVPRSEQTMEQETVFQQSYNIDSFLNMTSSRLCIGVVSTETRLLVEKIVEKLYSIEPEIAKYCVPPCINQGGCKEKAITELMHGKSCNYYERFSEDMKSVYIHDLKGRYSFYESFRYS